MQIAKRCKNKFLKIELKIFFTFQKMIDISNKNVMHKTENIFDKDMHE
jgi:hypothetical protein